MIFFTGFHNSLLYRIICFGGNSYYAFAFCSLALHLVILLVIGLYYCKWREGPMYTKPTRAEGKVVIVTGSNTGLGKETALEMARRGARVYMACRDFARCEKARLEIIQLTGNSQVFNRTLDLASLQSVRDFAAKFNAEEERLDLLINNAGISSTPRTLTVDGYEQQFAVNHLGHFLLTCLLLEKLKASAPSRIVVVTSLLYCIGSIQKEDINSEQSYYPLMAYGQSKLANILFTRKLARILKGSRVTVNCIHPGVVHTEVGRYNSILKFIFARKLLLRSPRGGIQTILYLALDPELEQQTGGYYDNMTLRKLWAKARDDETADWLWRKSERMVGLNKHDELEAKRSNGYTIKSGLEVV